MKQTIFELRDRLRHARYSWPRTLISYPLEEQIGSGEKHLLLLDERNVPVPFQLEDEVAVGPGGRQYRGRISFMADLPTGLTKTFTLSEGRSGAALNAPEFVVESLRVESGEGGTTADNGLLELHIPGQSGEGGPLFVLRRHGGQAGQALASAMLRTDRPLLRVSAECTADGPVFFEQVICCQYAEDATYRLTIRLAEGMDFAELREEIAGFRADEEAKLVVEWRSFVPELRYTPSRGVEKADQYAERGGGKLPFLLNPYDNAHCWHQSKMAAFSNGALSAGLFVRHAEEWDDGEYALWGSSPKLSVSFAVCPDTGNLSFEYPLAAGRRCTAVALYPVEEDRTAQNGAHINDLWLWQEFLNLDKVKHWILRWEEPKQAYPRLFDPGRLPAVIRTWFFERKGGPVPGDMEAIIDRLSSCVNDIFTIGPVSTREFFTWVPIIDLTVADMTEERFERVKAACAFMAYAISEECIMPIGHMLSGHPNFLMDVRSAAGLMSALFPAHPHARQWKEQFERAMALNLKYHIRPAVAEWGAEGGRHTENLACYSLGNLNGMTHTSQAIRKTWNDHPTLYPNYGRWLRWLLHSLTSPVEGVRHYPSQGAHAGGHVDDYTPPRVLRHAAMELYGYDPLLAEHLLHVCPPDAREFEEKQPGTDIWRAMGTETGTDEAERAMETVAEMGEAEPATGTRPPFGSVKFNGYGFVLRADTGEPGEMSVHLQQIDEGPNYRWGRAGEGGCGVIYYYADDRRYSFNRREDVGDDNMGDVQACCNFGVLYGHEYRSVGRNDLTEPLYDFGFAQYAKTLAGPYSSPAYRSRSVMMSGSDYIAIYDEVGDMRVRGRFAWFVGEHDEFPAIRQLKPGVPGTPVEPGIPADAVAPTNAQLTGLGSKGMIFDGFGHFLTVVTHRVRGDYGAFRGAEATPYGARIRMLDREDLIFRDEAAIRYESKADVVLFEGRAGMIRLYPDKAEAALFEGVRIGVRGAVAALAGGRRDGRNPDGSGAGIAFSVDDTGIRGIVQSGMERTIELMLPDGMAGASFRLYIGGAAHEFQRLAEGRIAFTASPGRHGWEWTAKLPRPAETRICGYAASSGQAAVRWAEAAGAERYELEASADGGRTWMAIATAANGIGCQVVGENGGKRHVRVRGVNRDAKGDWSPDYPIYFTDEPPLPPEGLRIRREADGFALSWGERLGVERYVLYRKEIREGGDGEFEAVYEGPQRHYFDAGATVDATCEYRVSCRNGNGEGERSAGRTTERGGLTDWDPRPDEGFRRYTRSHEYGYNGFDYWRNQPKTMPPYPSGEDR